MNINVLHVQDSTAILTGVKDLENLFTENSWVGKVFTKGLLHGDDDDTRVR